MISLQFPKVLNSMCSSACYSIQIKYSMCKKKLRKILNLSIINIIIQINFHVIAQPQVLTSKCRSNTIKKQKYITNFNKKYNN